MLQYKIKYIKKYAMRLMIPIHAWGQSSQISVTIPILFCILQFKKFCNYHHALDCHQGAGQS